MEYRSKITKLITKLIRLTATDKIVWVLKNPPLSMTRGTDEVIPLFFEAKYKDKFVAIYQQRYQGFNIDTESSYWTEGIGFAVLDDENRVVWESTEDSIALVELMNTVREKAAGLDDLLDDLLDDDENSQ